VCNWTHANARIALKIKRIYNLSYRVHKNRLIIRTGVKLKNKIERLFRDLYLILQKSEVGVKVIDV